MFQMLLNGQVSGDFSAKHRINGIIGESALLKIEGFDFIRAFVPEYMHCVCLGVIRYFLLLWWTATKTDPWYIGDESATLNLRLSNVKPPYEISRITDSFDKIHYWKASEFRSFALFYYPILKGILPEPFYSHFESLCYLLYILLQETVPKSTVRKTQIVLDHFVRETSYLYGDHHVTYNIHMLTHLPKSVLDWGCLWATSCFIPKWFNGELMSHCNGTQAIIEQMSSSFLMKNALRNEAISLISDVNLPLEVVKLLNEMLWIPSGIHRVYRNRKGLEIGGEVKLLGCSVKRKLTMDEEIAIDNNPSLRKLVFW